MKDLAVGEEARYTAEVTPRKRGITRSMPTCMMDGEEIDSKTDTLYCQS